MLVERAARLARVLAGAGAGPESVVALCLDRGAEMVTAMLGVWLAGAAYLPLDPGYPAGRLAFMLADSRAALVVGSGRRLAGCRRRGCRWWRWMIRATAAAVAAAAPAARRRRAGGRLAYVMYTSGSTGVPKGVGVPQGALANYVSWVPARLGWGQRGAGMGWCRRR